jgi:very-short-patch-repair endonuclease
VVREPFSVIDPQRPCGGSFPNQPNAPVDISVPSDAGKKNRRGIRLHRRPTLDPQAVTRHRGIAVTVPACTVADLAKIVSSVDVRRARRQAAVLGLQIDGANEDDATRSELEFLFLKLCRQRNLPAPEVNVWIAGVLVDFAWRERRLIVETDGYRYHRGRVSFEHERARDLQLRSHGFEVVRLTYTQVAKQPEKTAGVLRKLLA